MIRYRPRVGARVRCAVAIIALVASAASIAAEPEDGNNEPTANRSRLAQAWGLAGSAEDESFVFKRYRANYILPVSYRADPGSGLDGTSDNTELAFQISLKTRLSDGLILPKGALWFGYTQLSYWQAYNESSPFRESNFEPELRYAYELDGSLWGWRPRFLSLGVVHESNGRGGAESRSWDRVTAGVAAERGRLTLEARGWWRVSTYEEFDENPNITERVGRGEFRAHYAMEGHALDLLLRTNLEPGEPGGAVQVGYAFPLSAPLRGYVRAFHGYGDTLIDYDEETTRVGLGVLLGQW